MERNSIHNRLTNVPVDWDHFARVMEAKQEHNGDVKIAPKTKPVIAHQIKKDKWIFLTR